MATIVNSRDLKLKNTTNRFIAIRQPGIYLSKSSDNFIVASDGSTLPDGGIVFTVDVVGLTASANPVFTVSPEGTILQDVTEGMPTTINPKKKRLTFTNLPVDRLQVSVSLTDDFGAIYQDITDVRKLRTPEIGVSIQTDTSVFQVTGEGTASPEIIKLKVSTKYLEFDASPVFTLKAYDFSGALIPEIIPVQDVVNPDIWLLDYTDVASTSVTNFKVEVSVTDKYSVTHSSNTAINVITSGLNSLRLQSSSPFFIKQKSSGELTPSNIVFSAIREGITEDVSWVIQNQDGTAVAFTTGTDSNGNATATVSNSSFGNSTRITVLVTAGVFTDVTTVQLIDEALDSAYVMMANSTHEFDADATGVVYSFSGSGSLFDIYDGATKVSTYDTVAPYALGSYRFGAPSIVTDTGSISTPTFGGGGALNNYSSMSANTASVTIPVIITRFNGAETTISVTQTLVKRRRGATLSLSSTASSFAYLATGVTPTPTNATVIISPANISSSSSWWWTRKVGTGAESARSFAFGSSASQAYTPQAAYANMPETLTYYIYDSASGGNLLATSSIAMNATKVGTDGAPGQGQVKAVAFTRSVNSNINPPTGGSFNSPNPTTAGWTDGIPAGASPLWQSTRIFTSDAAAPQQSTWTTPQLVANTSSTKYQFSLNNSTWSDTASVDSIYMRTGTSSDGGANWVYTAGVKIKGENGTDGINGKTYALAVNAGTRSFIYAASGSGAAPSTSAAYSQTLTADGVSVTPTSYAWSATGRLSGTSSTATFTPVVNSTYAADSTSVSLTVTHGSPSVSITQTVPIAISKIGDAGVPGKKNIVAKLFKWSTSETIPSTNSTYNWNTGVLTSGITGWTTSAGSPTASGQKLYELSKPITVDADYLSSTIVDWDTSDDFGPVAVLNVIGIREDGSIGYTGPRTIKVPYFYIGTATETAPGAPNVSQVLYNFGTGAATSSNANWSPTIGASAVSANGGLNKTWAIYATFAEVVATNGTVTQSTPVLSTVFTWTNFDGLVTFTNLANATDTNGNPSTTIIDGGSIKTSTVTAGKILVDSLSAIQANLGAVTVASGGNVKSGKTTATDIANAGFFLGYNSPTYAFFIGNAGDTVSLKYDGNLTMKGGKMDVGTTGAVYGGQTDYATGIGFFLGYSGGSYKFSIGDSTQHLRWDGSNLIFSGSINTTGEVTARGSISTGDSRAALIGLGLTADSADARYGVYGRSDKLSGIYGLSSGAGNAAGVTGTHLVEGGTGITGGGGGLSGYGVRGTTWSGVGVYGQGNAAGGIGVEGRCATTSGVGVKGTTQASSTATGVLGIGSGSGSSIVGDSSSGTGYAVEAIGNSVKASIRVTNPAPNGLAIDANGGITAANNSTTVSTVKATNSSTTGVALEALGRVEASKTLRVTGSQPPTSGVGIELAYSGGIGYVTAYDRTTAAGRPLHMISSETVIGGTSNVPASSSSAGTQGQIAWDSNYIYVCAATNTWRRTALSTW